MLGIAIRRESNVGVSELNPNVNIMDFFTTHVFPELQDTNHANRPMVKATALKFVCKFRNQFTREQHVALMPLLIAHLASPSVVVHTYAAYAIERILITKETDSSGKTRSKISRTELQPFLQTLFTGLFQIVDNTEWNENEYVMKCIMRSLASVESDIIPVTNIVFEKLSTALARVCKNPRNPMFSHYLFESIAVLVRSVCSQDPNGVSQLEALLFPPFQTVLQMEIIEFTPYVFQLLAQLLEFRPEGTGLGDAYSSLFPPLLSPAIWEKKGNIPALVRLLQAYLKKAARELAQYMLPVLGIFQKLVASKATETNAFDLLSSIVRDVPQELYGQHVKTTFQILLTRLQGGRSVRYVRCLTNFFALFVGKFGAQVYFDAMNQIQSGVALTLLVQVWAPRLRDDVPQRLDAKIQVLGLTRLLCDTPDLLSDSNGKQIWAQTVAGAVTILTSSSFSAQAADDDEGEGEIEIGYDATYSGLTFARKKLEDPFPEVADPVSTFLQALNTLSASRPGVLLPIIHEGLRSDPKLLSGLEAMLQKSGVQLC
jgi:exportin-2 (importin alpha re-exporter)